MRRVILLFFGIPIFLLGCSKKDGPVNRVITEDSLIGTWKVSSMVISGSESFNVQTQTDEDTVQTSCGTIFNYTNTCTFSEGSFNFNYDHIFHYYSTLEEQVLDHAQTYDSCKNIFIEYPYSPYFGENIKWKLTTPGDYSLITLTIPVGPGQVLYYDTETFIVLSVEPNKLELTGNNLFNNCIDGGICDRITLQR